MFWNQRAGGCHKLVDTVLVDTVLADTVLVDTVATTDVTKMLNSTACEWCGN